MTNKLRDGLRDIFIGGYLPGSITQLKIISSLLSYYGNEDMPNSIRKDGNALRRLLVKVELVENSVERYTNQVQKIPTEFTCIFRNESMQPQMPSNFSFSPQINIQEYPLQNIEKILEEIQTELSNIDILGILMYIKGKASKAGDLTEAMK